MKIRQAEPADYPAIYDFVKEAFKTAQVSDGTEQDFVNKLRAGDGYIPELELVMTEDGIIIGHIMMTRTWIKTPAESLAALMIAPLGIRLDKRDKGYGQILMKAGLEKAKQMGYTAAFLAGNPDYYSRFGFQQTGVFGIKNASSIPDQFVLGLPLTEEGLADISGEISIE